MKKDRGKSKREHSEEQIDEVNDLTGDESRPETRLTVLDAVRAAMQQAEDAVTAASGEDAVDHHSIDNDAFDISSTERHSEDIAGNDYGGVARPQSHPNTTISGESG